MVALTLSAVTIVATAGAATPAILAGAQIGTAAGVGGATVSTTVGAATAVAGSTAVGGAAGAISGAAAGGAAFTGAAAGGVTGATAGAAVSSIGAGILTGPVGWTILGATEDQLSGVYTFDCWKPVLHDDSSEPSNGKILKEIAIDSRIKRVTTTASDNNPDLPYLVLENIWNEQFLIEYVYLPSGQLTAHAVKI